MKHIVIIGNGISGVTAARHLRKQNSKVKISIISAETDHFFSRTALMYIYMGHMRYEDTKPYEDWFWEKNKIELIRAYASHIDFNNKKIELSPASKKNSNQTPTSISYDKLILALGSTPNKFGWKGQDLEGVRGLYAKQDLDYMEKYSKDLERAVIVGGGLIGIEMAEMFHSRNIKVTFLVREKSYWNSVLPKEESAMINRHILENHIDLRLETELKEILDDGQGKVAGIITSKGDEIDCGYVGLTAGVRPNISFLKDTRLAMKKGILVNEYLQTNIEDVYAIGDCAEQKQPKQGRRSIEAVWYTGRMMGETVAYNLLGKKVAYDPGIWFNSAKFFDIEYQVYGNIQANPPEHHEHIYWEAPQGRKSIRIVFDKNEGHILGFNLMGIRYRHELCEKWIKEKTPIEKVLQHLKAANFDPEFYSTYESQLLEAYRQKTGTNLTLKSKRGFNPFRRLFTNH